jgi:hypothetical protein
MPAKQDAAAAKADLVAREEELIRLKKQHDISDDWQTNGTVSCLGTLLIHAIQSLSVLCIAKAYKQLPLWRSLAAQPMVGVFS